MFEFKRRLILWQTAFWNVIITFPREKINRLEKERNELEEKEVREAEDAVDKMVAEIVLKYQKNKSFKRKAHKVYIAWHALVKRKLVAEIGCCEKCKTKARVLTIDHIIPQSFLKDLGLNPEEDRNEDNFRLLCDLCNSRKGNSFDFTDPRTAYLLLDYLKKYAPKTGNPFLLKKIKFIKKPEPEARPLTVGKEKWKKNQYIQADISNSLKGTPYDPDNY